MTVRQLIKFPEAEYGFHSIRMLSSGSRLLIGGSFDPGPSSEMVALLFEGVQTHRYGSEAFSCELGELPEAIDALVELSPTIASRVWPNYTLDRTAFAAYFSNCGLLFVVADRAELLSADGQQDPRNEVLRNALLASRW